MKTPTHSTIEIPSAPNVTDGMVQRAPFRCERSERAESPTFTHYAFIILFLLATVVLAGCKQRGHAQPEPHWFKHYSHYHEKNYIQFIENQINNETDSSLSAVMARDFYRNRHFHPFWTQNGLQEILTDSLLASFDNALRLHGIPNEYFGLDSLRHTIAQLVEHQVPNNDSLYPYLYRLERQLTDGYVRYACALAYGATDPKAVNGSKWYYATLKPDSSFLQTMLAEMPRFEKTISGLAPQTADYLSLQKELKRLYSLPDSTQTEIPDFRVRKDGHSANLPKLCQRLNQIGFPVSIGNTLNDTLLQTLNNFRRINGIPESDSLDAETIEKLNRPLQYYKDAVAANLERLRWQKKHQKSDDTLHIAVNIPDYTLCVVQQDEVVMRERICCGKTQNPQNVPARHKDGLITPFKAETPLLYSQIRTLVLNPEWNIPYDIIKNEYYPKLVKSNTAVVNREHLYIRDSRTGRYVKPDSINWSKVNRNNIPYRLHQTSGRYNALGRFKFVFANSESVYLHDTNNKGAFKRRKRALSHGCVRVQNPDSVAEWVYAVNGFDTNYIEQLHILLGAEPTTEKGEKFVEKKHEQDSIYYEKLSDWDKQFYRELRPTSVTLRKPIPLFIEYYTCFVAADGTVQYREDVYYKDGNILFLMKHPDF